LILRHFTRKEWTLTLVCILFVLGQVYLNLRIPEYMTAITDAIMNGEPSSVIYGYGAEMIICALASMAVAFIASVLATAAATMLSHTLRRKLFNRVGDFTPEDVNRFSVDSLITRSTNDVTQVQQFITRAMMTLITTPIVTVWALIKISGSEWEWTAVTAVGVVVVTLSMGAIIWYTWPRFKRIPRLTDRINHFSLEHLTGVRVVRAYNAERFQETKFNEASDEMMKNSVSIWKVNSFIPALSNGISNFLTMAIYWLGIILISGTSDYSHQTVLFSDMIVFSSYATQILGAFMGLANLIQFSSRSLASSERIEELLDYTPCIPDGDFDGEGDMPGTVEFRNVDFSYPGTGVKVIDNVSFKVDRGQTVAIMGATGSGKSTLVSLVMRFYAADSGQILVNGVDVREYRRRNLSSQIGYVPQTNTVFAGTVEDNINYGSTSKDRTMDDIRRAESIAQASEFVDELDGRESFRIEEEGKNLSGGQKQRLSIARAICKDAPIWILDDPFSALDFMTDRKLRASMEEHRGDTTKILVSQRVGTVMNADTIIVLDEGRIIGQGKHEELMENCPLYREIAVSQMTEGTY